MKIYSKRKYNQDELVEISNAHRQAYLKLFKSTVFVQTFFPIVLCFVFYSIVPASILFLWLLTLLTVTSMRAYFTFFWFDPLAKDKIVLFEKVSLFLSFIAGCLWGMTVLIIDFKLYPVASVFLNLIVFGLTAGSVGIGSYWFSYFVTYNFAVFSFYIVYYLINTSEPQYLLAISYLLFLIFMLQIALAYHRSNAENIWLNKRNEKLTKSLSNKKNQAEELASSRSRFLASASHDLRQPLQSLNLFLTALKSELTSPKSQAIYVKLEKSADDMNELLTSILDVSKLDANTLIIDYKPCCVGDVLEKLNQQFLLQAKEKQLNLIVQNSTRYVKSDPVLLQRILSNLISNAIKYTDKGSVHILIEEHTEKLVIRIKDTGSGLTKKEQKMIFEEFLQLQNPERDKEKGIGLGLSIVRRLCDLMTISLELDSIKGEGSCFSIALPLCEAIECVNKTKKLIESPLDAKNILIIEDDRNIREGLIELLTQWQCKVIDAESAEEACDKLLKARQIPDLIIADYRLRNNKTGVEAILLVKLSVNNQSIPAIILSGDTEPNRLKEVAKSGYDLLHKPVKPAQLRMLVQQKLKNEC